jgi:hypothetical protein
LSARSALDLTLRLKIEEIRKAHREAPGIIKM